MLANLSLRWRLTLWYLGTLLVILLGFGVSMHAMIRNHFYARQDAELKQEATEIADELAKSPEEFPNLFQTRYAENVRVLIRINREDGSILCGSTALQVQSLPPIDPGREPGSTLIQDFELPNLGWERLYSQLIPTTAGLMHLQIAVPISGMLEELRSFTTILIVSGALALIAACLGGMIIVQQALHPLEQMMHTAERISMEDSVELVLVNNPNDELGRLATTLNSTFVRMRKSVQQMGRFTADAAHELRTPLAVLRLECDVALNSNPASEDLKKSLRLALEEIDRLSKIVDELLVLSRMDSGTSNISQEDVYIAPLLDDVVESLESVAIAHGVALSADSIPDAVLRGNDVAISRLFFNLIDNAIKFTPPRGKVQISAKREGNELTISVADTGIGIERDHWDHLFDRFYRVDASRNFDSGGTGLGLAICKSIADAHGATISIDSTVGKGTTFSVMFVLQEAMPRKPESPDVVSKSKSASHPVIKTL